MRVAVYGTLKFGGALHGHMKAINAKFVKETTLKGFSMYNMGWYPAIVEDENGSVAIEVYEIGEDGFSVLDAVEGYPSLYQKKETEHGIVYFMDDKAKVNSRPRISNGNWKVNR